MCRTICRVCGTAFKAITNTHLATHGLDFKTYTAIHGNEGTKRHTTTEGLRSQWAGVPLARS